MKLARSLHILTYRSTTTDNKLSAKQGEILKAVTFTDSDQQG